MSFAGAARPRRTDLGLHRVDGLTRADCQALIRSAGLPVPPPSSCWFCPNHDLEAWRRLRRERPDLFERAVELEGHMNRVNEERGRRPVWFNRTARPLAEVVADQLAFDAPGMECDSGYCAT